MIKRLDPLFYLAEKYGVEIIKTETEEVPGELVYEDEYQIGVIKKTL